MSLIFSISIISFVYARSNYLDLEELPGEKCARNCDKALPQICYFQWHLEFYHVLGPLVFVNLTWKFYLFFLLIFSELAEVAGGLMTTLVIVLTSNASQPMALNVAS
jgi:uncharacterized membrane protein (DUF106 family)